jgi:stage II sporulation protein AA (anti-sigma F factor antagonist)
VPEKDAMHVHTTYRPGDKLEPASTPLTLERKRLDGGVLISVIGEVDMTNAGRLESYVARQMSPGEPVVLDLGLLTFMDSNGLRALENLHAALREGGTALHLAGVHGISARLLQVTGVWPLLNIHPSVAEAVHRVLGHDWAPPAQPA